MTGIIDIRLLDLALAMVIVLLPVLVFLYFRVKVIGDVFISLVRMVLQLSMVALYLEWIFEQNSAWINLAWVFVMVLVSVFTTIRRVGLKIRYFVIPFLLSGIGSIVIVDSFFLGYVIKLEYLFDARYFVPITGMVLGNSINHNVVGLGAYFDGLRDKSSLYYFLLTNTGSQKRAIRPYISDAIRKGLNPLIATMSGDRTYFTAWHDDRADLGWQRAHHSHQIPDHDYVGYIHWLHDQPCLKYSDLQYVRFRWLWQV
jgi:putative ABC transport system permease protein